MNLCKICNQNPSFEINSCIAFPADQPYFQKMMSKQKLQLNTIDLCSRNKTLVQAQSDICESCWQYFQKGFECAKCKVFNYCDDLSIKKCSFCLMEYCKECEQQIDLFSQNGLCITCQKREHENLNDKEFLKKYLITLIVPCLLLKILFEFKEIDFQRTNNVPIIKKLLSFMSIALLFPLVYVVSILTFFMVLINHIKK